MSLPADLKEVDYYFITDESLDMPVPQQVRIAVEAGVKMVQYRRKDGSTRELYCEALEIKEVCKGRAIFVVNDRVDIAMAVSSDGVHLGQDDLPPKVARRLLGDVIIGISTHDLGQALEAVEVADYIGIGPVKNTKTKSSSNRELGVDGALDIAEKVDVPTAAIGGIENKDLPSLAKGFDMVCAISSVCRVKDLERSIKDFAHTFKKEKLRYEK